LKIEKVDSIEISTSGSKSLLLLTVVGCDASYEICDKILDNNKNYITDLSFMIMKISSHSPKISWHIPHFSISLNLFLLCSSYLVWGISAFAVPTTTRTTQTCGSSLCPKGTQQKQQQQRGERHALQLATTTSSSGSDIDYEIEPLPIRIGHGFDIHRMAPLEEAGQPLIIGGVVIPHSNQKVCCSFYFNTLVSFIHLDNNQS
jgi:hypothetical protein